MRTLPQGGPIAGAYMPPLRIVHYMPGIRLEQGGVVRATIDWCSVFAERGHRMTLITYERNDVPRDWFGGESGKPCTYVVPAPSLPGEQLGRRAIRVADEALSEADVLHLHAPWSNGNRQLAKLARRHNVPYLVTLHGMLDDWAMKQRGLKKKIYLALFGRRFLDGAACVHCTAERELLQASKWFTNQKSAVLPYLVDLTSFERLPGPDAALSLLPAGWRNARKILFLSRLHPQKGIDILIQAAGRLRDDGVPFVLMVAGNGEPIYERYLYDLMTRLNLCDRVLFLGLVTGLQKVSLYQAADIFVLPTRHENFGLVLTEALACGTPVVTTRGTDIWQEVRSAGGLIADATTESIAAAVSELLGRPQDLAALGARGRRWVFEALATESLAQRYEALYRELIECSRSCGNSSASRTV